jgi:hypothetical protein
VSDVARKHPKSDAEMQQEHLACRFVHANEIGTSSGRLSIPSEIGYPVATGKGGDA